MMDPIHRYRRCQDGFEEVIQALGEGHWEDPSPCAGWTARDVAGHAIWVQHLIHSWATDGAQPPPTGAPGSAHPGKLAGDQPTLSWRAARRCADASLTPTALNRVIELPRSEMPLVEVLGTIGVIDLVGHSWDLAQVAGISLHLEPELFRPAFDWARSNLRREPQFFGPEQPAPAGASELHHFLAYLGRTVTA